MVCPRIVSTNVDSFMGNIRGAVGERALAGEGLDSMAFPRLGPPLGPIPHIDPFDGERASDEQVSVF
jgi:hypothetical protein